MANGMNVVGRHRAAMFVCSIPFNSSLRSPVLNALNVAQQLLDVRLQCPLGGEFRYGGDPAATTSRGTWSSTAWAEAVRLPNGKVGPPQQYSAPWLEWFRGGRIHLTQLPERLAVVGTIDLELPPRVQSAVASEKDVAPPMSFDLFQLPFKLFGDGQAKESKADRKQFLMSSRCLVKRIVAVRVDTRACIIATIGKLVGRASRVFG